MVKRAATDPKACLREVVRSAGTGERLTPQRAAVWQVFAEQSGHLTAESVLSSLHGTFPGLNTGTVYRELAWLKRHGLICETDVGCGPKVYERVTDPCHHHLVCLRCGDVGDLPDRYFSELRRCLLDELGFAARIEHFAVYGVCRDCTAEHTGPAASS